jgi:hypothetical protein
MDSHTQELVTQSLDKVRGQAGKHLFWLRHPETVDLAAGQDGNDDSQALPGCRRLSGTIGDARVRSCARRSW